MSPAARAEVRGAADGYVVQAPITSQGSKLLLTETSVFPTAKNAATEAAIGGNPKLSRCMTDAWRRARSRAKLFGKTPRGTTLGTPLVSPAAPAAFGPGVVGYSLSVPITSDRVTLNVTVTQLIAVKGRLGHQVTFTSVGAPFSTALQQQIMAVAARRL